MSIPLQIALFLASAAVVIFVAFCIPVIIQFQSHNRRMMQTLEQLKAEISLLIQDSRKMVHSVNELSTRANQQCDDVERVIQTVRGWTGRVDRVVGEVGSVLEPPLLTVARNAQIFRKGIVKFFETFLNRNHHQLEEEE
jgi:uncharacterized protein YoxC